jgi:exoribonuclease R
LVVCEAISSGSDVPEWVHESLPAVPGLMQASVDRASRLSSASIDRVEAATLRDRVGDTFTAWVLEVRDGRARIQLTDPIATSSCHVPDSVRAGTTVDVRLEGADIATGTVRFTALAGPAHGDEEPAA